MALLFGDYSIPGTHETVRRSPWMAQMQETRVFGQPGITMLVGELEDRELAFPMWIHDEFETVSDLYEVLEQIELLAKQGSATLAEDNSGTELSWGDCKFMRLIEQRGIMPSNEIGWFYDGVLIFKQLTPPEIPEEA